MGTQIAGDYGGESSREEEARELLQRILYRNGEELFTYARCEKIAGRLTRPSALGKSGPVVLS